MSVTTLRRVVVILLTLSSISFAFESRALDDDAVDRCMDACVDAEDACVDACPDGLEGEACVEACEVRSSDCMDVCEAGD